MPNLICAHEQIEPSCLACVTRALGEATDLVMLLRSLYADQRTLTEIRETARRRVAGRLLHDKKPSLFEGQPIEVALYRATLSEDPLDWREAITAVLKDLREQQKERERTLQALYHQQQAGLGQLYGLQQQKMRQQWLGAYGASYQGGLPGAPGQILPVNPLPDPPGKSLSESLSEWLKTRG